MLFYALSADEARAIRASDMTRPCIVVILIGNA